MDYLKKSRIEEVLIAILGKGTVASQLISRIEKILDAIRVKGSYDGITMSEVEEILICILLGKRFEKPTHSRIAAMLKVKANSGEYTELRKSRVEELIFEWINAVESATYTGTLPATLQTVAGYLESYKIYGNTVQDGTPTPENPIVPSECGERTGNLLPFDDKNFVVTNNNSNLTVKCENGNLYMQGNAGELISSNAKWKNNFTFELEAGTYYCNSPLPLSNGFGRYIKKYDDDSNILQSYEYTFTITEKTKCYLAFYIYNKVLDGKIELMLNTGSTALPYEPYGYKLPLTVNGVEYPIYLGESQTTRRIKKLVLTGEEGTWARSDAANNTFYFKVSGYYRQKVNITICSHYTSQVNINGAAEMQDGNVSFYANASQLRELLYVRDSNFSDLANLKSYLAAQYAAGTPVTVWYVLAEPETGIVNEPLMKIGVVADTVSMEQAGVSIPTVAGTTVIDYNGEPKPDKVELTYSKPK